MPYIPQAVVAGSSRAVRIDVTMELFCRLGMNQNGKVLMTRGEVNLIMVDYEVAMKLTGISSKPILIHCSDIYKLLTRKTR